MGVVATRSRLEKSLVGVEGDQSHLDISRKTLWLRDDQPYLSGPVSLLVHDRPWRHRDDGFRGRWAVAPCAVWTLGVVVFP